MVALKATCEEGWHDGADDLNDLWEDSGSNCNNIWDLEDDAEDLKDEKYSDDSDWSTASYNECAQDAIDAEVRKLEEECLENDSSQCMDLGYAAAELVVKNNWCTPDGEDATTQSDYKAECKEAATSICEGQIPAVASRWCPEQNMSTSQLLDLQDECEDQVDSMVPGAEVE